MIKLTSFYLFTNLLRISQEFFDDKISVKAKSLTAERNFEIKYKEITKIEYENFANNHQMNFGMITIGLTSIFFSFFIPRLNEYFFVQKIGQVIFILGWFLFFTGFIKLKHCFLLDKNNNILTGIKITSKTENDINSAIRLVKQHSKTVDETNPENPFPVAEPVFEFIDYDIPDSFNKSITRFYDTELIDYEKSLTDEVVTRVKFNELIDKTTRGKRGNNNWTTVGCNITYISLAVMAFPKIFNLPTTKTVFIIFLVLLVLSIIAFSLRFIKEELIYFDNLENKTVYSMRVTKTNKEKIEKIIQFVEQKTNKE